jgi:gliding motility-associated-like protein
MVTSNRFKVPRISVLFSMVGVFLLSLVSFEVEAQCYSNTINRHAGTWHSNLYIGASKTGSTNVLVAWGESSSYLTGSGGATGTVFCTPTVVSSSNYSGIPIEVRASSSTGSSNKNIFLLRTEDLANPTNSKIYLYGDGTLPASFGGATLTTAASEFSAKLPTGVSMSDIAFVKVSPVSIAIITKTAGNVYMTGTAATSSLFGDNSAAASNGNGWHKVLTAAGTPLAGVTKLTISAGGAVAISGQNVYFWGINGYIPTSNTTIAKTTTTFPKLINDPNVTATYMPTLQSGETINDAIALGDGTSTTNIYFLTSKGRVFVNGGNAAGELGNGSTVNTSTFSSSFVSVNFPVAVNTTTNPILKIDASIESSTTVSAIGAMDKNGNLYTWGDNNGNMIGGAATSYNTPQKVNFVPNSTLTASTSTVVPINDFNVGGHFTIAFDNTTDSYWYLGHFKTASMGAAGNDPLNGNVAYCTEDINEQYFFKVANTSINFGFSCSNAIPTANISTSNLAGFTACTGAVSAEKSFTVSAVNLTDNLILTSPVGYEISTTSGTSFVNSLTVTPTAGSVPNTNVYVRLRSDASNGASGNIEVSSTNAVTQTVATGVATVTSCSVSPTITTTGTTSAFTTCINTASTAQSFAVAATDLTADLTITAPAGFEIATSVAGTYSNTLTVAATSGTVSTTNIWVRLTGVTAGNYTGTLTCASTGATSQTISLTGTTGSIGGTVSGTTVVTSGTNTNTLTLSGYTGTIQWQSSTNNITFTDIPGATTATYTASNVAVTTYYKALVTNGSCALANSTVATISFENGCYSFDIADFTMNGNATLLSDNSTVRLTQALGNQNGSIWNKNKINLDYDFDISTSINLGNSNAGADGIAFVLQNQSVNAGSTGGGLGYMGIQPSFAVEFDTYFNAGADPGTGADHIAMVKNGNAANIAAHSEFAPPYEVEMEDGLWHDVRFVWTAATKNFKVYWNGSNTPLFNITQDLKANIFSNSSNVYFGLTAATGGAVNLQQVKVPTYCLVKQVAITPKAGYLNNSAATTFCAPAAVVLEASTSVSYLWYKDGVAMTDSTSSSIIVTTSGVYKVEAVDGRGITSISPEQTVTVAPATVVGTITRGDVVVCSGTNNTALTLVGSTGTIQWKSSTDNITYTNITGATSATYTASNLTATTYYKAAVTSGSCSASISAPTSITVIPVSVAGSISGATTVCAGTNNTVLTLVGSTGTIQWQSSTDNSTFTNITGATSATYTATNLTATTYYKAVVTSGACSAATTSASTITVSPVSVAGTISGGNVSVCLGSANSTTMTLAGYVGTIQWQSSSDNINFTNITGATSASFTATNLAVTTYYKAVVTSGACSYSATASVAITVSQCIVANPDINTTNVNTIVSGSLNTNDKTTSGTSYGPSNPASTNPSGGSLTLNANGSYTFNASLPGRYIYYVQVCGAGQTTGCAVAPLEITVIDPNSTSNAPIVNNDYTTTQVNTPVNVRVLSNDRVVNAGTSLMTNTVTIVAAPNNGSASVNSATGVVTFTPNTGFAGTDSLNYKVCDNSTSSNCQIATVYFKVSSSSVAEYTTADDDFNNVNMNSTVSGNVLTNDVNSANNTLTVTSNSTPLSSQGTIRINTDGSYTFTPTANFFGPLDITYTACTNGSVCATATLHILVSPVKPAAPTVAGGTYVSKDPTNPANIGSTVSNIPAGSKAIYCDINGLNCSTTTPVIPMNPGIYIWCVKSLDTITNLTSSPCIYDTISVLPYVKVVNATYVNGVATNPKNIAVLISEISAGSIAKWCNVAGTSCTTTAPSLPTIIGKSVWCVKAIDTASGLSSIICKMDTVTILDPYTVMELSKSATSVKLNPDGTILLNFVLKAINKTDGSIDSVSIKDDLTRTFNTSRGILVYSLDVYGGLVKNVGYDGIANIELLDPSSKLAAKKTDSVVLKVLLESPDVSGTLNNTATMTGKTKYGKFSVISNDPLSNPSDSTIRIATSFKVPKVDVIVAGGFSPNQDGMNDKWIIVRPFGTIIQVKVFNRWGNLVYENENYTNDWDGRGQGNFMGQYLPEGTYFYMVEATDANGNVQKFAKSLTIVR